MKNTWINSAPVHQHFNKWLRRRHPEAVGTAYLFARNIYILPTRAGFGFSVLLNTLLIGSINYANNLGYMMTFWLSGLFIVAMLMTYRNLVGLTVSVASGEPVFCGEEARFDLRIQSKDRADKGEITVEHEGYRVLVEKIDAQEHKTAQLVVDTEKRGLAHLQRIKFRSHWPLGLFRAWTYANLKANVLVYPQPLECSFPGLGDASGSSMETHRTIGADGDQFDQLQKYRPGESLSRVAWKLLAKNQGMHSKQFSQSVLPELVLDFEHVEGDLETRLSRLTYLVCECSNTHSQYGLRMPGQFVKPDQGKAHRERCLELLAMHGLRDAPQ